MEPAVLELGLTTGTMDGHAIRIYDKDRLICDCLRYRNKMNERDIQQSNSEIYRRSEKASRSCDGICPLRVKKLAKDLIGDVAVMAGYGGIRSGKTEKQSKSSGISYQQCLQLFFQEEFLRRLAGSSTQKCVLKGGGLFIYTLTNFEQSNWWTWIF